MIDDAILRLLIEAALSAQPFNEQAYLEANPDVAKAVSRGQCASGRAHYVSLGYFEGRSTGEAGFAEAWYLQKYPDVAQAVAHGESESGLAHFLERGQGEWRSPTAEAERDISRWYDAIMDNSAASEPVRDQPQKPARPRSEKSLAKPARRGVAA
jgi:hypothetical protein